jgi:hyperosmotically inducible protein
MALVASGLVAAPKTDSILKEVRHELVMLPNYGIFDELSYRVDGTAVTLFGAVTRPTLKSEAENVVRKIEGVTKVENQIEVLPDSPNDDQIRRAVYRAVYGSPGFERYGFSSVQAIHIIVNNGNVSLVGTVSNEGDKNIAGIRANGVAGVFAVKNELQINPNA